MSVTTIIDTAPLRALIRYTDGSPKPPARFTKKLAAWEQRELLLRSDADAWFHCFFTVSADRTIQILSNPFQQGRAGAHFYDGAIVHLFPDPECRPVRVPFELVINDETHGLETLTCFATQDDVSLHLPPGRLGESFDLLPQFHATRLRELFTQAAGGDVGHAKLTVTLVP
jgi:hypothetical protein